MWTSNTMTFGESLVTFLIGFSIVFFALIALALFIIISSKVINLLVKEETPEQKPVVSNVNANTATKAVAKEGGKYNIACNAVCPSFTRTDMTTVLSEDKEKSQKVISMIPLGRRAEPVEIAQMILFFASDLASFITGEIGDCDGGITLDG